MVLLTELHFANLERASLSSSLERPTATVVVFRARILCVGSRRRINGHRESLRLPCSQSFVRVMWPSGPTCPSLYYWLSLISSCSSCYLPKNVVKEKGVGECQGQSWGERRKSLRGFRVYKLRVGTRMWGGAQGGAGSYRRRILSHSMNSHESGTENRPNLRESNLGRE